MHSLDSQFFDEYKRLDKLCSDMYTSQAGVSAYIADMEQKAGQGQFRVPFWSSDYKKLKRVRWVRTRIAHDLSSAQFCEEADLEFVRDFYRRILNGQDPLTLLRRSESSRPQKRTQATHQTHVTPPPQQASAAYAVQREKKKRGCAPLLALTITFLLILFFMIFVYVKTKYL